MATALNQQGFLFSQVIREKIRFDRPGNGQPQKAWKFLTEEFSVTAADGAQTRIDLVLGNVRNPGAYLCIECKRMNPLYKEWIFFDRRRRPDGSPNREAYFESFRLSGRPIRPEAARLTTEWNDAQLGRRLSFSPTILKWPSTNKTSRDPQKL